MTIPPKENKFGPLTPKGEKIIEELFKTVALSPSTFNSELKPVITMNREQDRQAGYKDEHHLIQEKVTPMSIQMLAKELAEPQHVDIYEAGKLGKSFEECMGIIAAKLDIALDGSYDAAMLADVLLQALRRRKPGAIQNHHLADPRLKNVELVERQNTVTLEEVGEQYKVKGIKEAAEGEGPYTICRTCINSFDCITNRSCKNGTPAQQLGNTMKVLKETLT